jgi:N6-adenosine-specific RNA methylase IME4
MSTTTDLLTDLHGQTFRTIVADPPWEYPAGWPMGSAKGQAAKRAANVGQAFDRKRKTPLPYPAMTVAEIAALPVSECAADGCHLYLWTTNKYLESAFGIVRAWGFEFSTLLAWCKTPMGQGPGGTFASNMEFVMFSRRGKLRATGKQTTRWWNWKRMGKAHSRKPEAFQDMVETVSPGPYLELFARRHRRNWVCWGNEVETTTGGTNA